LTLDVIDDLGMLPSGQQAAEAFYRVVDAAYEKRSVAVTSNLHPAGFDTIMSRSLATAAVVGNGGLTECLVPVADRHLIWQTAARRRRSRGFVVVVRIMP